MWAEISSGQVLRTFAHPTTITFNGITYPRQIFQDSDELKKLGILPYRENSIDTRYHLFGSLSYVIGSDEVVGTYDTTDKDITTLKKEMIRQTRESASHILTRDDWMAIREVEGGTEMPDNIITYRSAVRTESGKKEDEINALSDLDAVKLYEAIPYIETRKEEITNEETGIISYGDNYETERYINLVTYYLSNDPLAEVDPAFVSLVKL
jgi:hypothetical protein